MTSSVLSLHTPSFGETVTATFAQHFVEIQLKILMYCTCTPLFRWILLYYAQKSHVVHNVGITLIYSYYRLSFQPPGLAQALWIISAIFLDLVSDVDQIHF